MEYKIAMKYVFSTLVLITCFIWNQQVYGQFTEEKKIEKGESEIEGQVMNIHVLDADTQKPDMADVRVNGLNPRKQVVFENVSDTAFEISTYRLYTVSCLKKGYMYYNEKFWPEEAQVHEQYVELRPLEVGLKTSLRDILFLGDKTEIYPKCRPALDELVEFLELNDNVKISVIGHVNGPDNAKSAKFYHKASVARAQAVIDYLVNAGIDSSRLKADGKGNTEMLYPDPSTDWQNEANRRIEIEIIGL